MLTLDGLYNAYTLADDLRRIRTAIKEIREDVSKRCDLRVHGLRRTYGITGDTHQAAAPVQKSRVLVMLAEEEAEIVAMLHDLGVDALLEATDGR